MNGCQDFFRRDFFGRKHNIDSCMMLTVLKLF
jgi:hypothetical protein